MEFMQLPKDHDDLAPDGSEIRLLPAPMGGLCHCSLGPGRTSSPKRYQTVEEIWFFLRGEGEVWRKYGSASSVAPVGPSNGTHHLWKNETSHQSLVLSRVWSVIRPYVANLRCIPRHVDTHSLASSQPLCK